MLLSCAGAYVSGADGSNECPAGSVRIETEAACRTAVTGLGKAPGSSSNDFVESLPGYPRGCYYDTRDRFAYFNPHAAGAGILGFQLLCAAATTGAPPPHAADARAFTGVCIDSARLCRTCTCAIVHGITASIGLCGGPHGAELTRC